MENTIYIYMWINKAQDIVQINYLFAIETREEKGE